MTQRTPLGVAFDQASLIRCSRSSDNWCIIWAADGHQYTAMTTLPTNELY